MLLITWVCYVVCSKPGIGLQLSSNQMFLVTVIL